MSTTDLSMNTTIFNDQNNEYIEDYFNALLPKDHVAPESESWQTFTRGLFVLLLRAGYILIQIGSIPVENVYIILLNNLVDIAVTVCSFALLGYMLAFGKDTVKGYVGYNSWIGSSDFDYDNAIFGLSACLIGTAIISTMVSARTHTVGHIFVIFVYSGCLLPLAMHWIYHDRGWMHRNIFYPTKHKISLKDHAGGVCLHTSASTVGLIGILYLGRRLLILADIDDASLGPDSPSMSLVGYVFVCLGLIAFALPTPYFKIIHIPADYAGIVIVNSFLAMSGGILVVVSLHFLLYRGAFNYWILLKCTQGSLAGLVAIASGIDVYRPWIAFAFGSFGSVAFYFVSICIKLSSLEDYCNVLSINFVCGFLGALAPPLLGHTENLGPSISLTTQMVHLLWQIVCFLVIIGTFATVFTFVFLLLHGTGFLRNKREVANHLRAQRAASNTPQVRALQRLFRVENDTPWLEPGTSGKSPEVIESYRNLHLETNKKGRIRKGQKWDADVFQEDAQKPRFVYTVANVHREDHREEETKQAGGDAIRRKVPYKLHRTKKCTNFKQLEKTTEPTNDAELIRVTPGPECITLDKKYNDDIVTLKIANNYDNLSDSHEEEISVA